MTAAGGTVSERWGVRTVPDALARRYRVQGWWTDESLGAMVATGLRVHSGTAFRVRSRARTPVRRRMYSTSLAP